MHHHRADDRPDPHSPLVSLFWSYMGWLFIENTDLNRMISYDRYARDIIRDRFYAWLERTFVWVVLASWLGYFAVGFLACLALTGTLKEALQYGASIWLWGAIVRTLLVWHITWCATLFFICSGIATTRLTTTVVTISSSPSSLSLRAAGFTDYPILAARTTTARHDVRACTERR